MESKMIMFFKLKYTLFLMVLGGLICLGGWSQGIAQSETLQPPMVLHTLKGDEYAAQGMLELAIKEYEKALAVGAGSAQFLNRLGEMYLYAERFDESLNILHQSLSEDPEQLSVLSKLSEAFLAQGKLDSAIHYVKIAGQKAPESPPIYSSLGFLYLQAGKLSIAKANLDKALILDPNSIEAHRFMGFYYTQIDSVDRALEYYRTLTELMPNDVEAHNNIAFLLAQTKQFQLALEAYERSKKMAVDPVVLHAINVNIEAIRAIMDGKMRARYILVGTASEARNILEKLDKGQDFGALADQFSIAPNAKDGGDVGFFNKGDLMSDFERVVERLEIGQVSEALTLPGGVWIIQRLN